MSDLFLKTLLNFTSTALATARGMPAEEGDNQFLDELDSDCKVNWYNYADESKWKLLSDTTEGITQSRVYGGTEAWMPGYLRVDATTKNGLTVFETFVCEPPDEYIAPGCKMASLEEAYDDDEEDDEEYGYFVDEFPERLHRAMLFMIRTRPVVPNTPNGPTLPTPVEYVEEEIPKPADYGGWA